MASRTSPKVITKTELTLDQLEDASVTIAEHLPQECQHLYASLAGKNICLDTPDFTDFSKALQHSISSPKGLLHGALKKRAAGAESCTRVDFADNRNIVLKIYPCKSTTPFYTQPTSAITKLLYGSAIYRYHQNKAVKEMPLHKGDITWLSSSDEYQLENTSDTDICVTIQARQAESGKTCEVANEGGKDWASYKEFKEAIRAEWKEHKKSDLATVVVPPVPFYI